MSRRAARTDPGGHAVAIHFGGGRGESRAGGVASGPRGCVSCEVRSAAKRQLVRRGRHGGRVSWSRSCCARFGAQPIVRGRVGCLLVLVVFGRLDHVRGEAVAGKRGGRAALKVRVVGWESRYKGSDGSSSFSLSGARAAGGIGAAGGWPIRSATARRRAAASERPRPAVGCGHGRRAGVGRGRSSACSCGARWPRATAAGARPRSASRRRGCVVSRRRCGGR